jgi:hypothetical protein
MALTECSECDGTVSSKASACPHCGYVINKPKRYTLFSFLWDVVKLLTLLFLIGIFLAAITADV